VPSGPEHSYSNESALLVVAVHSTVLPFGTAVCAHAHAEVTLADEGDGDVDDPSPPWLPEQAADASARRGRGAANRNQGRCCFRMTCASATQVPAEFRGNGK
jgi:hypothetical protein